ncbi:hypothetical protein B296_00029159 [Ensete ventricosum]|uniref:Uncharacterized protein n=1 Tax=Ensete ventricosum TaxID=4639 RepID=A0A427A0N2_ENSVE|nr:hypothetical protein B296_00029159 [Ensete ventricosum]
MRYSPGGEEERHGFATEGGMRNAREIAADTDIDGLALLESGGDRGINELVSVLQVVHHRLRDGLEAPELLAEVREADGVVEDAVRAVVVGVRPSDDADNGEVLAVRAGDGVEHTEPADGKGHDAGADPAGAGVAVSGVPGVEFVTASHEAKSRLGDEVIEEGEVEVAGHGEDVEGTNLDEAAGDVAPECGVRGPRRGRRGGSDGAAGVRRRAAHDAVGRRLRCRINRSDLIRGITKPLVVCGETWGHRRSARDPRMEPSDRWTTRDGECVEGTGEERRWAKTMRRFYAVVLGTKPGLFEKAVVGAAIKMEPMPLFGSSGRTEMISNATTVALDPVLSGLSSMITPVQFLGDHIMFVLTFLD